MMFFPIQACCRGCYINHVLSCFTIKNLKCMTQFKNNFSKQNAYNFKKIPENQSSIKPFRLSVIKKELTKY